MSEQIDLPLETVVRYFDVIYEFGLLTNSGHSPVESADHPYRIPISFRDSAGLLHSCTAYGQDVIQVCQRALEFLEPRGWVSHSQKMEAGLMAAAHAIANTVAYAVTRRKVEIYAQDNAPH